MQKLGVIRIDERFCGPPGFANGGYVSGLLAQYLPDTSGEECPQVRLHAPVPLATALDICGMTDGSLQLMYEDELLATCRPSQFQLQVPNALAYPQAAKIAKNCYGLHYHPFPECFVCGPQRSPGDGLRIFPGRVREDDAETSADRLLHYSDKLLHSSENRFHDSVSQFHNLVAAPWIPDESLRSLNTAHNSVQHTAKQHNAIQGEGRDETVAEEFIWAALDCTGSFPIDFGAEKVLVLGQLKIQLLLPVSIGECYVVMGWLKQVEGRKHFTGTALFNAKQALCGLGQAVWIQLQS